jgi:PRTRC genetic system protein C
VIQARYDKTVGSCHLSWHVLPLSVARIVINSVNLQGGLNITMTIETMAREFRYDELRLPDPNPRLSVDEVRTAFSATYPEIATAALTGPEAVGNKLVYHFTKAIGTKG